MRFLKCFAVVAFIFIANLCTAQEKTAGFTFGIVLPDASAELNVSQIKKLETKISQIITKSGQAIVGYDSDFVIYPVLSLENTETVQGGMQNIVVSTFDLTFFVKQVSTNVVYNSIAKKIKGSGSTKEQAANNAISQINTTDDAYSQFIIQSKSKILKYFAANCKTIILKATNQAHQQNYEYALALLQSIPAEGNSCYNDAQAKSLEYYKQYQSVLCTKNITLAKSQIAANHFDEALETLQMIDPASKCASEVNGLIAQISSKVTKMEKLKVDQETQRINAIKEISKAYYSRRTVNYNVIIR